MMMLASMAMMFNPQSANDPDESRRTYLRHLSSLRDEALDNGESQRRHELHRHPAPEDLQALAGTARMWERAGGDEDAFEIRIGLGPAALVTPINVAESGAAEDLDPVCAVRLRHTLAAVSTVADMPVALQLQAFRFLGLAGRSTRCCACDGAAASYVSRSRDSWLPRYRRRLGVVEVAAAYSESGRGGVCVLAC